MKWIILGLTLATTTLSTALPTTAHADQCKHPYVYFDLGETLIDTASHNYNPMALMADASVYISALKGRGYQIGLISDVPETWGRDETDVTSIADYPTAKWMRLLNFVRGSYANDHTSWSGPVFDEAWFGAFENTGVTLRFNGNVYLPLKDAERKKSGNPVLFMRALERARAAGCEAVYMGEDPNEIALARSVGLAAFQVGHDSATSFYLPLDDIDAYAQRVENAQPHPLATARDDFPARPFALNQRPQGKR